ncbi:unnamed protein product [Prorocentrum cordatum]|uniref:Uncharacterized protein n=1 Tax=Prorocentrum cordatum TaxID=2364126 RepID=A0ABN9WIE3_9DINO|nr:unnamed protein product [Polarella glacialis]|mmetsp:Transcript_32601/g.85526  ORF Transcript_32601/g.85526 Transcript_32601/m.85526 type:complete len:187 (+) Transcript_32601:119-679(+)
MGAICPKGDVGVLPVSLDKTLVPSKDFVYSPADAKGGFKARLVLSLQKAQEDERYWERQSNEKADLFKAAERNDVKKIKELLEKQADAETAQRLLESQDEESWTPLHRAASKGHTEASVVMLRAALDPEALLTIKNTTGSSPAHLADFFRHLELALLLEPAVVGKPPWDGVPASKRQAPPSPKPPT